MDILFTGATSLAAREFIPLLRKHGHRVTCVSRKPIHGANSVVADLTAENLPDLLPNRDFDALVHFASYVPTQERTSTWDDCYSSNVLGTAKLLQWADGRIGRILVASSCSIYGARRTLAATTEKDSLRPETYYAVTKYAQEQLVSAFSIPRRIPYCIMRLGYVYGPGIIEQRAIVKFIRAVQEGRDITLTDADGTGLHLVHTADVAQIGLRLLHDGVGIYNVLSDEFVSLLDYVQAVMRICGKRVNIIRQAESAAGRLGWYSIGKLRSEGLHSTIGLDAGIRTLLAGKADAWHA